MIIWFTTIHILMHPSEHTVLSAHRCGVEEGVRGSAVPVPLFRQRKHTKLLSQWLQPFRKPSSKTKTTSLLILAQFWPFQLKNDKFETV